MKLSSAKIPWFGVALIMFGALLLIDKLHLVDLSFHEIFWPVIMLLGLAGVGRGFMQNRKAKIFFGTVVFLYALFFFLHSMESVDINSYLLIPSTFLILGIAFLMVFCNNFQEWIFLIPSVLLGGIGVALMLGEMGVLYYWEVWDAVAMYWPVALVLFGLGMVLRRKTQQPDNHATT